MRIRHVLLTIVSVLALGAGAVAPSAAAQASVGSPAVTQAKAHTTARPLTNDYNVCAQNGSGYCLDRNQCGTASGTHVIMWVRDTRTCIDFEAIGSLTCGSGVVTQTCPFTVGSGLNSRYAGSKIWYFETYQSGTKCLATDGGGGGILGTCPDRSGNGGSNGTIFVQNSAGYVVNRYWSDYNYSIGESNSPSWMCSPGSQGQQVLLYDDTGSAGSCQWYP